MLLHAPVPAGAAAAALESELLAFAAAGLAEPKVPKQVVFAAVGLALYNHRRDLAVALCLSWDAFLRLPSDLVQLRGRSLVPPTPLAGC